MKKMKELFFQWLCHVWKKMKAEAIKTYEVIKSINTIWSFGVKLYRVLKPLIGYLITWGSVTAIQYGEFKKAIIWLICS